MLEGKVQVDDAYLGGERTGGKVGRGSENKVAFVAAVSLTEEDRPLRVRLTPVPGFTLKAVAAWAKGHLAAGSTVFSEGLACFGAVTEAGCTHHPTVMAGRKPRGVPGFKWINTVLSNLKTSLSRCYHAFDFRKYAVRIMFKQTGKRRPLTCKRTNMEHRQGARMIKRMDHFTIVTDQLDRTRRFYTDLLRLAEGPRPPFPVPGYWLYTGNQAVLHVIGVDQMPEPRRGVLDHMAFHAEGLSETLDHLDKADIRYKIIRAPGDIRTWQVFLFDPNGVEVELDFDPAEPPPADWKVRGREKVLGNGET